MKPFVTEYKGSRRASPLSDSSFDTERSTPKPADVKPNGVSDDDSYEAAMRAADALFATPSSRKSEPQDKPAFGSVSGPTATPNPVAPLERGGRVLRVIDEAPAPQLAALEAQHAPRRRGRKPGSKNKPKIAAVMSEVQTPQVAPAAEARPAPVAPAIMHASASTQRVAALSSEAAPPRSDKKFAWVRDRLKPGENWKRRRLPRVCW